MNANDNDIQQRVADDVRARVNTHRPEGISVLVVCAMEPDESDALITQVAFLVAAREHSDVTLTGRVLYVERDALGENRHEVVLEVGADSPGKIVYAAHQNNR
jgi:hypothetical protein